MHAWWAGDRGSARVRGWARGYVQGARVSTCPRAWSWPLPPELAISVPKSAADSEGGRSSGSQPCSPGRWPGQGGRLRPSPGRAGAGVRASCLAGGGDSGRKVGPTRKALPGEASGGWLSQLLPSSSQPNPAASGAFPDLLCGPAASIPRRVSRRLLPRGLRVVFSGAGPGTLCLSPCTCLG